MTRITVNRAPRERLRTLYAVLGAPPDATLEELKHNYYLLAKEFHPDTARGDGVVFREITYAWSQLRDPERRRRYDAKLLLEGRQCTECRGAGRVFKLKRGRVSCPSCEGTGQEK